MTSLPSSNPRCAAKGECQAGPYPQGRSCASQPPVRLPELARRRALGEVPTGLLSIDLDESDTHSLIHTDPAPLNSLTQADLTPPASALDAINAAHR